MGGRRDDQWSLTRRGFMWGGAVLATYSLSGCRFLSTDPDNRSRRDDAQRTPDRKGKEAPSLARLVEAGELPPVEERLPKEPLVVEPVERIGTYGGTWRTAILGPADAAWIERTIGYDNLVRWDPDFTEVIPNLARAIETSPDGRVYTIQLREGVRWSDGEPFTADDLVFANEDVVKNEKLSPVPPENPATFEKLDDYTVRITFERPNGLFLSTRRSPVARDSSPSRSTTSSSSTRSTTLTSSRSSKARAWRTGSSCSTGRAAASKGRPTAPAG
ncbi:ABC transporter substrate-binding protein [Thermasporomyces composti]|uniref:ABC transporter substrate-binding protein n=1 Tax=Thermasporomyces composti TaxID=696763 RepID=UPI000E245998|nr:ABC transporter substrate-binding protein [Thermasporomyces composti]